MKENIVKVKSYEFAVETVKLCLGLQKDFKEYSISQQLLRSAASVGANIEESIGGQSDKDFLHKLSISYKEARESHYWIRLLFDVELIDKKAKDNLIERCEELLKILGAIIRTMRVKLKEQ